MSNVINSASLFHFTKEMDALKGILKNGLRFSYCFERVLDDPNTGIAIPMISFCDIPLMNTSKHREEYGNYAIGFNKDIRDFYLSLSGVYINPIFYIDNTRLKSAMKYFNKQKLYIKQTSLDIATTHVEKSQKGEIMYDKNQIYNCTNTVVDAEINTNTLFGFIKPYKVNNKCFYDEREWRAMSSGTEFKWYWDISQEEFEVNRSVYNKELQNSDKAYLSNPIMGIANELIVTHIIVKDESEVADLIDHIMRSRKIFGCKIETSQKKMLISRITSFERISIDY